MANHKFPGMVVDIRPGESLSFDGPATVELLHKSGQAARLRVVAARDVRIEKGASAKTPEAVPSMAG